MASSNAAATVTYEQAQTLQRELECVSPFLSHFAPRHDPFSHIMQEASRLTSSFDTDAPETRACWPTAGDRRSRGPNHRGRRHCWPFWRAIPLVPRGHQVGGPGNSSEHDPETMRAEGTRGGPSACCVRIPTLSPATFPIACLFTIRPRDFLLFQAQIFTCLLFASHLRPFAADALHQVTPHKLQSFPAIVPLLLLFA